MHLQQRISYAWNQFCHDATGEYLPLNFIDDNGIEFAIGHERSLGEPPVVCVDGTAVRRLRVSFIINKEDITWS